MAADGDGIFSDIGKGRPGAVVEPPPDNRAAHRAAFGFAFANPDWSARDRLSEPQARAIRRILSVAGCLGLVWPDVLLAAVSVAGIVLFAAILVFRAALYIHGAAEGAAPTPTEAGPLPVYTLLIALKDEAATAPQLAAAIRALDYPPQQLDVKLLIEAGDASTRTALLAEGWPAGTELLTLPPGLPRTKPRALNYGLARALGEFVVVYDAEDRPHPDQLRAAVQAFRDSGPELACVQAPLAGEGQRGWIAGQWALEYALQFGRLLPAQAALGLPVMLGGTSNHFRRSALEAAGGWDAWNVTEDADLGLRLARIGCRVGVIPQPTLEAPPERLLVWVNQRSRWLKGFLQTWLVLMRSPRAAISQLGWAGFLSVQLTLGAAILSALVHGPWSLWLLAGLCFPGLAPAQGFLWLAGFSYAASMLMAAWAPGRKDARRIWLAATLPLYWPLQTLAMGRALWGMARCPHFWAKTPHVPDPSVSKPKRSAAVPAG